MFKYKNIISIKVYLAAYNITEACFICNIHCAYYQNTTELCLHNNMYDLCLTEQ